MNYLNLGNRFFVLTIIGYCAALVSCALVVFWLSAPFLRSSQIDHLQDVANQQANAASFMVDEIFDRAEYLARVPVVLDLVTGMTDGTGPVSDQIRAFTTAHLIRAVILDYKSDELYSTGGILGDTQLFMDVEYREGFGRIADRAPGAERTGRVRLRVNPATGETHMLIAVPILINGAMEGAVVLEKSLALETALPGGSRLISRFQHRLEAVLPDVIMAPVSGFPLFVRLGEKAATLAAEESQALKLVIRIMVGLAAVLLIPFLAMSVFGARYLVEPTHALARSRAQMAQQQVLLERQSEELRELAAVAELSRDAITVTDKFGRILWVNHSYVELTGYAQDEVFGKTPGQILKGSLADAGVLRDMRKKINKSEALREEIEIVSKCGRRYWIALSVSPIMDESGKIQRYAAISSDVTERRKVQEALAEAQRETEYRASHDTLTGLPNRRRLDQVLDTEVVQGSAPRTLIRVDLDYFKNVNDTHGHAAGDHVLQYVSDALTQNCRAGDLVARVGGDEFVVLLEPGSTTKDGDALCKRFRAKIRQDILFEGKTCRVGASFGVVSAVDGLVANDELLVAADAALYVSKSKGRNTTTIYTPEIHSDVQNKRRFAMEIERAIAKQEFEPYFQPQVDAKTRQLAGLEALVRWNHPEQGVLAPFAFLPLAEQLSLVPEIDEIVYNKGLLAVQKLNREGFRIPKVSFNVGVKQLENPLLKTIHHEFDLGDTRIAFEVLESVLVEEQASVFAFNIDLLRDRGFLIEVDDFGSGHASVVGLLQLKPDAMKLDQRLIMPLTTDPSATVTVRALVEIGYAQGIEIIAEGVETEEHARILTELGVSTLQGYRFARPMHPEQLRSFLTNLQKWGPSAA